MSEIVLGSGDSIPVTDPGGGGPIARLLETAIVPDERSTRAERGRALARDAKVFGVTVRAGEIEARVEGSEGRVYTLRLRAEPMRQRVWHAVSRSEEGARLVAAFLAGQPQAVRLEHLLTVDWDAPLVPRRGEIERICSCPDSESRGACKHVIALGYVIADAVGHDPSLLLRWRGCTSEPVPAPVVQRPASTVSPGDPWEAGALPVLAPARPLPVAAVLKRLGPSGLELDSRDLADVLERAYVALVTGRDDVHPSA